MKKDVFYGKYITTSGRHKILELWLNDEKIDICSTERNHSHTIDIGFLGSSCAQLSLLMLSIVFDEAYASENDLYQRFKRDVLTDLARGVDFEISVDFIRNWAYIQKGIK